MLLAKTRTVRPEAQSRIGDIEDVFSIYGVAAVAELVRRIPLFHAAEIAVGEAGALDLFGSTSRDST